MTDNRQDDLGIHQANLLDETTIREFPSEVRGRLIRPHDDGYDEARSVFYGGFDRRPALIVRVEDATDVSRVVALARKSGLELAVEGRTAWAQTGLTAGEYTAAAGAHGLATGFGDTGSVGIGGITLGGGVGYLVRKHGLTIDDLLAAELVTADGQLLHVDDQAHPELFWAIRGGGGNFGVVTRFQFRLHELRQFVGGLLVLPATPGVIAAFVAEAQAAPEELSTIANVMPAPPLPFVPAEQHGRLVIMATLAYAGAVEDGQRAVAPFRALATPIADLVRPMPYPQLYPPEQEGFHPTAMLRTMFVDAIDRDATEAIVEHLQASTASLSVAQLRVLGGAMARVPVEATAFAHRHRPMMAEVGCVYQQA